MTTSSHIIAFRRSGASSTKTETAHGMMQGRHCHWCQKRQLAAPGRRV